jgi:hypothetical protein
VDDRTVKINNILPKGMGVTQEKQSACKYIRDPSTWERCRMRSHPPQRHSGEAECHGAQPVQAFFTKLIERLLMHAEIRLLATCCPAIVNMGTGNVFEQFDFADFK